MELKAKLARFLARKSLALDSQSATNVFIADQRGMLLGDTTNCDVVWQGDVIGCLIFGASTSLDLSDGMRTKFRALLNNIE